MADESQERTEEATPRQLHEARRRGQVAISRDLDSAVLLLLSWLLIVQLLPGLVEGFSAATADVLTSGIAASGSASVGDGISRIASAGTRLLETVAPGVLLGLTMLAVVGAASAFIQVGPIFAGDPLKPQLNRLSPLAGLKRLFATRRTWVELLKSLVKFIVVATIVWMTIRAELREIVLTQTLSPTEIGGMMADLVSRLTLLAGIAFLIMAAPDVVYQWWQWRQDLRMSRTQVQREQKENENLENKQRRRAVHSEIALYGMLEQTRKADVVIVNPTHYAAALRWDQHGQERAGAPRLLAKGTGVVARRIRQIAREEGIPIYHRKGLAQALQALQVNAMISQDLYAAVTEVLQWVDAQSTTPGGRVPSWRREAEG